MRRVHLNRLALQTCPQFPCFFRSAISTIRAQKFAPCVVSVPEWVSLGAGLGSGWGDGDGDGDGWGFMLMVLWH